jgi:DNA-directed RNA polymerase subunit M/transcription elongation factor TFIIS
MGISDRNRRCPKCGGNLYMDRDYHGWYEQCLQCSYMKDLKVIYQRQAATPAPSEESHESAGIA